MSGHRYWLRFRPASFCTLPEGVRWSYVEAPFYLVDRLPDLPVSGHNHGVIETDRELTAKELDHFDIVPA
jgi:hypothetical protein